MSADRAPRLAKRISLVKRAVIVSAVACFAAVGTAAAVQGSTGKTHASQSTGSGPKSSGLDQGGYWAGPTGGSALDGPSSDAPVAGTHAS
jgi:hypothetical protein